MLVFSAISPHSPLLIPSIARENHKKLEVTLNALADLEKKLLNAKPEVIIIISPHGLIHADSFTINFNPIFKGSLKEFGDFSINLEFPSEPQLTERIRHSLLEKNIPVTLESINNLDYGITIPLYFLTKRIPSIPIMPINNSFLNLKTHFDFGRVLKEKILESNKRIAVIASADLSHKAGPGSPIGFSEQGKKFDEKLIEFLNHKNITGILKFDEAFLKESAECGLRPITILLGVLEGINYKPQIFSYEAPFGVGYLTAHFKLL